MEIVIERIFYSRQIQNGSDIFYKKRKTVSDLTENNKTSARILVIHCSRPKYYSHLTAL